MADDASPSFGPNDWLVDEMYDSYRRDPSSVSESWRDFFADYRQEPNGSVAPTVPAAPEQSAPAPAAAVSEPSATGAPAPAPAPSTTAAAAPAGETTSPEAAPIRGAAARIVANMEASLKVPTATSARVVPAKLLEVNRRILNNHLSRTRGAR